MRHVLPAQIKAPTAPSVPERLVIVTDHDATVVVRWRLGRPRPWRCAECGPQETAECPHAFAASLALAETLLGLTRAPEYEPTTEGTTP